MEVEIGKEIIKVIIKQKKIKRTYLRITNNKELVISSPVKLTVSDIKNLVINNYDWLIKRINNVNIITINEGEYLLFGKTYKLENAKTKNVIIDKDIIRANSTVKVDDYALRQIEDHFHELVRKLNFSFLPELQFRKMRSRWGVCHYTKKKVILNKVLIHLPWHLVDYVIFHELTHFKIPNHSKKFYFELNKICPNHKVLKTQLLEYGSLL